MSMPGPSVLGQHTTAQRSTRDAGEVYGLLALHDLEVALPLSVLREVVACPAQLSALPVTAAGLLGALELRSLVVPVVDLRILLGLPAERTAEQVVVLVAQGERLLGVLVDAVRGVLRLPADALLPLGVEGEALLVSSAFRHPEQGHLISVLDAGAVLALPGVPTVTATDPSTLTAASAATAAGRNAEVPARFLTLLQCGPYTLGVDVASVHTTLPGAQTQSSILTGELCRGVTPYAGSDVPVVDPLVLLGLGRLPDDSGVRDERHPGAGLVLDLGRGYVVLALTGLLDIVEVADADVLAVPGVGAGRPDLLRGIADLPGVGTCLVLDGGALSADPDLFALAGMNTERADAAPSLPGSTAAVAVPPAGTASAAAPAYLTYRASVELTTPLQQVTEILPFPTDALSIGTEQAVLGVIVHRRAVVPVLCLAQLLNLPPSPVTEATCLLLVDLDGTPVAYAVDTVTGIGPLSWQDPDAATHPDDATPGAGLAVRPLVRIGEDSRLLPAVDLFALAQGFSSARDPGGPVLPPQRAGERHGLTPHHG